MKKITLLLTMIIGVQLSCLAEERHPNLDCESLKKEAKLPTLDAFKSLQTNATDMAIAMCKNLNSAKNPEDFLYSSLSKGVNEDAVMEEFAFLVSQYFPESVFPGSTVYAQSWMNIPYFGHVQQNHYPNIEVNDPLVNGSPVVRMRGRSANKVVFLTHLPENSEQQSHCHTLTGNADCRYAMDMLSNAMKKYNYYLNKIVDRKVQTSIDSSLAEWEIYRKNAPTLGFFSRLLTTKMHSDHFYNFEKNPYPGPPPTQWRALELSLAFDYQASAQNGEETKPAAAIEWIGYNDWNASIPWGIGLTSVYSDRAESKSVGHGIVFHLKNEYSFGVVKRGDDHSVYFNIDLMNWFSENKERLSDYVE